MMTWADNANIELERRGVGHLIAIDGLLPAESEDPVEEVGTCGRPECLNFFDAISVKCFPCTKNPAGPHFDGDEPMLA